MLRPDYFDNKADLITTYYQQLEEWIFQDIANRLLTAGEMSGTADWQLWKLKQMGLHQSEIMRKLMQITGLSNKELKTLLQDAVITSWKDDRSIFEQMGKDIISPLDSVAYSSIIDAEYKKCLGELSNLTNTTLKQTQLDLINLLNEAELKISMGNQSYSSAICEVLDAYAQNGVRIAYPLYENGKLNPLNPMNVVYDSGTVRSLESAVEMAVRTSMNQTAAQVTNAYIEENEIEYVLVSAHTGARHSKRHPESLESHDWWQGKVFKIHGSEKGYPNLAESTGYDIVNGVGKVLNPLGLHGYNCRHSHQAWDKEFENPWIDKETGKPLVDKQESIEKFENLQKQRSMERSIRKTKRELYMKKLEIDGVAETDVKEMLHADYDRLAYKLREKNKKYNEFCVDHDLQKQSDRVKVAMFNREQARKANGRATVYINEMKTFNNVESNMQNYKTLDLIGSENIFKRDRNIVYARKLSNYNAYLSKEAKIKPKDMHQINMYLQKTKQILDIENEKWLPDIVITSHMEMKKHVSASYNRYSNTIFINDHILNTNETFESLIHEYIHWKDANEYKNMIGMIDNNYMDYIIRKSKSKLDKLSEKGYTVISSEYAKNMLSVERYDEVYTEYRTYKIMKGVKK